MRSFRRVARCASRPRRRLLQQRDPAASQAAVGLELGLAGATRADTGPQRAGTAAEALEVLPHAPHARQVVLELRELHLELSLGADSVLGEDVEDQLRPVDDTRRQRVLERPLLGRVELVVDEQDVGPGVRVGGLQLGELTLADVGTRIGVYAVLDDVADRLDAGSARELAELRELVFGIDALREDGDEEPALELGARRLGGRVSLHFADYAPSPRARRCRDAS